MQFLMISFISIILLVISPISYSYKVLVISPTPIIGHIILNRALIKLMLDAGFEVTHITVMRQRKFHPNLKQIYVSPKDTFGKQANPQRQYQMKAKQTSQQLVTQKFSAILQQTSVNTLLLNTTQKFDLVIAEWLFSSIFAGFAALYDCPLIWFGTSEPHVLMYRLVDKNFVSPATYNEDNEREAFAKIFEPLLAMRNKPLYSYEQMRSVASLVLLNSHGNVDSEGLAWPKKFIPIAGFHVGLNMEPLHKTVKRIMDNGKQGIIYLSLGINIQSMELPSKISNNLLQMLGNLKQTVLWQQEQEWMYLPSNVHVLKWSSQQRILAHPNCVLFITHGGGLSTMESLHFGVPMIGLPVFGDQLTNVNNLVAKGVAKKIAVSPSMVEDVRNAIFDMLSNPSYREKAKQLSTVCRRRSMKVKKDFIYWVNQTIQLNNFSYYDDMGPLHNTYMTFKRYIVQGVFNVGIVTMAALILIPFSFKLFVSLHTKPRKIRK